MVSGPEAGARRLQPGRRAGDHDRASVAVSQERRHRSLDGEVHTVEHDVHGVEVSRRMRGLLADAWRNPCIGQDEVDSPKLFFACIDDRLKLPEVTHIGVFGHDPATGLLDEIHCFIEVFGLRHRVRHALDLRAQIDGDDVGAQRVSPCPRAAPVMNATFPSNCGAIKCSCNSVTATTRGRSGYGDCDVENYQC
jgi:acetamidase/formamidase